MTTPESVQISDKHSSGMDEWWCTFYVCPACKSGGDDEGYYSSGRIISTFKFCPDCGTKLQWVSAA